MARRCLPCLLLLSFWWLVAAPARADGPCRPSGADEVVGDLEEIVETAPETSETWVLPTGELTSQDLEKAFETLLDRGEGIFALFGMLADGQARTLPGDVVRELFEKYGVSIDFLPLDTLQEITSDGASVTFKFDFGGDDTRDVKLPDSQVTFLKSRHSDDPTRVHRRNYVKETTSKGRTLRVSEEVRLTIDENGVTGIREGDIKVGWFLGWLDMSLHTEHEQGKQEMYDGKYPVLVTGEDGEPVVVDDHYQVRSYDDWVIIEAAGRKVEIGVPALER